MSQQEILSPTEDYLWKALERVLGFYQVQVHRELIESQIAIDWSKPLTPNEIMFVANQLGLETMVRSVAGYDINNFDKPNLVLISDARVVVALPETNASPNLWTPNHDIDLVALTTLKNRNLFTIGFDKNPNLHKETSQLDEKEGVGAQWFWELFWKQSRDYVDIGIATFFMNFLMLTFPLFSMTIYDRVLPNHGNETLVALSIGMILVYLFNFGFRFIRSHVLTKIVTKIATKLDINFMDHLLRLSVPANKISIGEKFDLFHELQGLRDFFAARFIPAVVDMPFFVVFLLVIYVISPGIMIVVLISAALMLVINLSFRVSVGRTAKVHYKEARNKNGFLVELLSGAEAIRMFNAAGYYLFRWQRLAERVATSSQRSANLIALGDELSSMIMGCATILTTVVGVLEYETGDLSMGGMIACNMLVRFTLIPIMGLGSVLGRVRQSFDQLKMIDRVFRTPAEAKLTLDYEAKAPFKGHMKLNDITFYHLNQVHPTLYHMTLDIKPGEKVGLIGRTGAGKSTITRLLYGDLQPQTGHIFAQEPFVFSGTLRENILLGIRDRVDESWLKQVLVISGLEVLLQQSGYSLDFQVGEVGSRLSGGQRQSLALARALIRRPQILLLDEPTNGMDSDLEQRVMTSLKSYSENKTVVLVTHRTPLLALVDRLVLVEQGRIMLDGPRDEVISKLSGNAGMQNG